MTKRTMKVWNDNRAKLTSKNMPVEMSFSGSSFLSETF